MFDFLLFLSHSGVLALLLMLYLIDAVMDGPELFRVGIQGCKLLLQIPVLRFQTGLFRTPCGSGQLAVHHLSFQFALSHVEQAKRIVMFCLVLLAGFLKADGFQLVGNGFSVLVVVRHSQQFVQFLNPRRIVVLGDDRYVQPKFVKLLDRSIPIVRIEGDDWNRIAEETTLLLSLSNLSGDYKKLREEIMSKGKFLRPTPRTRAEQLKPVAQTEAPAEDEGAAVEEELVEFDPAPAAQAPEAKAPEAQEPATAE